MKRSAQDGARAAADTYVHEGPGLVEVTPSKELVFHPPFTAGRTAKLTLRNLTHDRVAFKVKTTAPKLFLVRPNSGILPPMAEIEASGTRLPRSHTRC